MAVVLATWGLPWLPVTWTALPIRTFDNVHEGAGLLEGL